MKKSHEILGLPVLSLADAAVIGEVRALPVNSQTGKIDFILVKPEQWYLEHRVISFAEVSAIGEDALLVENSQAAVKISACEEALKLVAAGVFLTGTQIMTTGGRVVGTVSEIVINEKTGELNGCEWKAPGREQVEGYIPAGKIKALGKELVIVDGDFRQNLWTPEELTGSTGSDAEKQPDKKVKLQVEPVSPVQEKTVKKQGRKEIQQPKKNIDPIDFFDYKQKQFVLNRKVTGDILTEAGKVIAQEGDIVTQEIIEKALEEDKFVELTLKTNV